MLLTLARCIPCISQHLRAGAGFIPSTSTAYKRVVCLFFLQVHCPVSLCIHVQHVPVLCPHVDTVQHDGQVSHVWSRWGIFPMIIPFTLLHWVMGRPVLEWDVPSWNGTLNLFIYRCLGGHVLLHRSRHVPVSALHGAGAVSYRRWDRQELDSPSPFSGLCNPLFFQSKSRSERTVCVCVCVCVARVVICACLQVVERNLLLFTIVMMEEIQSKPVVCTQFFLWNMMGLLRYADVLFWTLGECYVYTSFRQLPWKKEKGFHCNTVFIVNIWRKQSMIREPFKTLMS